MGYVLAVYSVDLGIGVNHLLSVQGRPELYVMIA